MEACDRGPRRHGLPGSSPIMDAVETYKEAVFPLHDAAILRSPGPFVFIKSILVGVKKPMVNFRFAGVYEASLRSDLRRGWPRHEFARQFHGGNCIESPLGSAGRIDSGNFQHRLGNNRPLD